MGARVGGQREPREPRECGGASNKPRFAAEQFQPGLRTRSPPGAGRPGSTWDRVGRSLCRDRTSVDGQHATLWSTWGAGTCSGIALTKGVGGHDHAVRARNREDGGTRDDRLAADINTRSGTGQHGSEHNRTTHRGRVSSNRARAGPTVSAPKPCPQYSFQSAATTRASGPDTPCVMVIGQTGASGWGEGIQG